MRRFLATFMTALILLSPTAQSPSPDWILDRIVDWIVDVLPIGPGVKHACPAGSTSVTPSNFTTEINSGGAAGEIFCFADGNYNVTTQLVPKDDQKFVGIYSDGTRPRLATTQFHVFKTTSVDRALFKGLEISGATRGTSTTCDPRCGRGIGDGGENITVDDCWIHDNGNAGIGGLGTGLTVLRSIVEDNGFDPEHQQGSVSAANIKAIGKVTVRDSIIRRSGWSGIWKDNPSPACTDLAGADPCTSFDRREEPMILENNTIVDNRKVGVHYELTTTPANPSRIKGNVIRGNGWDANMTGTRKAEVIIGSAEDVEVTGNTFGDTPTNSGTGSATSVLVYDDINTSDRIIDITPTYRTDVVESTINIHDNKMTGDACSIEGNMNNPVPCS